METKNEYSTTNLIKKTAQFAHRLILAVE